MSAIPMQRDGRRSAFTLIELMVVIAILALLSAMGVAFLPSVNQRRESAYGAEILQNALASARQRARRDGLATGVRIYFNDVTVSPVSGQPGAGRTRLKPVQTPPDYNVGVITAATGPTGVLVTFGPDPVDPLRKPNLKPIQDQFSTSDAGLIPMIYLEIAGSGVPHRISPNSAGGTSLNTVSPLPYAIGPNAAVPYRIFRAPVPIVGDEYIDLPSHIKVLLTDTTGQVCSGSQLPDGKTLMQLPKDTDATGHNMGGCTTIMFNPGGGLDDRWIGSGGSDKVILYVCDERMPQNRANRQYGGFPTLVTISIRTGYIACHPVDSSGNNPFTFCNKPRSSGM